MSTVAIVENFIVFRPIPLSSFIAEHRINRLIDFVTCCPEEVDHLLCPCLSLLIEGEQLAKMMRVTQGMQEPSLTITIRLPAVMDQGSEEDGKDPQLLHAFPAALLVNADPGDQGLSASR
jgi:hypothetical protein